VKVEPGELWPLAGKLHTAAQVQDAQERPPDLTWRKVEEGLYQILLKGQPWETPFDESQVLLQSENLVTQLLRERLDDHAQLHAGGVVSPDGKGWLICGASGSGKTSTTVAALLQGWGWLSDEYALLREDLPDVILGFPRNFNLKERSWNTFPETAGKPSSIELFSGFHQSRIRLFNPLELKPESHRERATLSGIALPVFKPEAGEPTSVRISGIQAFARIMPEFQMTPPWTVERLNHWLREIPVFEICYADPRQLPSLLGTLLD